MDPCIYTTLLVPINVLCLYLICRIDVHITKPSTDEINKESSWALCVPLIDVIRDCCVNSPNVKPTLDDVVKAITKLQHANTPKINPAMQDRSSLSASAEDTGSIPYQSKDTRNLQRHQKYHESHEDKPNGSKKRGGHPSEVENRRRISPAGSTTSTGVSNVLKHDQERKTTTALSDYLFTSSADNPETDRSGHPRDIMNHGRSACRKSDVRRKQHSNRYQQSYRYSGDHVSSSPPPGSDTRQKTPHFPEASPHSNVPLEDHENSPEGATGGPHQTSGLENVNFVPVNGGVFCYMKKMLGANIRNIESKFNVKISSEDIDVNESSMLKITPVGLTSQTAIRGANGAVVDLYSTVFSQLSHRVVQLEGYMGKELLQRAISDVERLYKDVLVVLLGSKVMIYGMKELDVKIAKAMVTNRLYDTRRSAPRSHRGDHHNDDEPDDHIAEKSPHLELEDGTRDSQSDRYDRVPPEPETKESHHPRTHEDLQGFEAGDEGHAEDAANREDDSSSRIPDEEPTRRTDVQGSGLKYRFRHDRLSF